MKKITVITHANTFHADEVLAIATLYHFYSESIEVLRLNSVVDDLLQNPELFILDIGGNYNPDFRNFDHHQDYNLPATNILILNAYCKDLRVCTMLKEQLFQYVSDVDKGLIITREGADLAGFNSIIRNLNNVTDGFEIALDMAIKILKGYISTAKLAIEREIYFHSLEKKCYGRVVIEKEGQFIPNWKELAKEDNGILMMISPNPRAGWQIVSRDTEEFMIPPDGKQTFRHQSGFMAVYKTIEDALEHAEEIVFLLRELKPQL